MPPVKKGATTTVPDEFDFAPAWRPEIGDVLRGRIKTLDMGNGEYGPYPIVTVETEEDGDFAVHAFHQALRDKLRDIAPKVGQGIAIKYFGPQKAKDDKFTYERYVVKSDQAPVNFWDKVVDPEVGQRPAEDDIPF